MSLPTRTTDWGVLARVQFVAVTQYLELRRDGSWLIKVGHNSVCEASRLRAEEETVTAATALRAPSQTLPVARRLKIIARFGFVELMTNFQFSGNLQSPFLKS